MELAKNEDGETNVAQNDDIKQEIEDGPSTGLIPRLIPGYETFDDFLQEAYDAMRAGIKAANNLPTGNNFNYYACFPSFNDAINKDKRRILSAIQAVIKLAGGSGTIGTRDSNEKFDLLVEANDQLLDQANILMDEESGIMRNPKVELVVSQMSTSALNGSWNARRDKTESSDKSDKIRLLAGKNVQRPQLMFKDKIDNSPKPWVPRIKDKPNSLKPLALYVEENEQGEIFSHPYEFELDKFEVPECQLKKSVPVKYKSLEDTALKYIDKPADLRILLEDLKNYKEIAIDLEHHSYRTFQGITCLMQISTGDTDYLVDTLTLRSELHQLNEIFTKPSILKVFHGADSDILWLQKDLSLYVVNMFDTHQAAKRLNHPYLSLAYLLKKYCDLDPNKHFQLADWRIRPLPAELIKYAREDTHYLLYVKDMLKNELIDAANGKSNVLKAVYDQSTDICKQTYAKPVWTEESCMNLYRRSQKTFNNKQMYALLELHKWRDNTAREEDDSIGYVLPNHMLLNITETLPREMQGILACCNPIPPLVRQNLLNIHKIVLKAREQPLVKFVAEQDVRQRPTQQNSEVNSGVLLYTPHDIPSDMEARANLPCLLDKKDSVLQSLKVKKRTLEEHVVTVFDTPVASEDEETKDSDDKKKAIFISPFMRYKCVIPMVVDYEAKEREKQQKEEENCSTAEVELDETEINESKNRVLEHFKEVSQVVNNKVKTPVKKKKMKKRARINLALREMEEKWTRKRKRESNIKNESQEESYDRNYSTSTSSLGATIAPKQMKPDVQIIEERNVQQSFAPVQDSNNFAVQPMRNKKKKERKANEKLLKEQGMLPSKQFDYKSVDFSSFQGGSRERSAHQALFQPQQKRKERQRNWKKQKLNI